MQDFLGFLDEARVFDLSILNAQVIGSNNVRGLAGRVSFHSKIENSYFSGSMVAGNFEPGGIASRVVNSSEVVNSFWDVEASTISFSAGGTGLSTAEMKNIQHILMPVGILSMKMQTELTTFGE